MRPAPAAARARARAKRSATRRSASPFVGLVITPAPGLLAGLPPARAAMTCRPSIWLGLGLGFGLGLGLGFGFGLGLGLGLGLG